MLPADVFGLTAGQFETFVLVMVRVSIILFMIPIFSANQVPMQIRFGLGLLTSFVIYPTVPTIAPLTDLGELASAVFSQAMVGLVFGFVAFLVFTGVQFAGAILDLEVGFSVVNVINPLSGENVSVLGEFVLGLATLLYLITDSHFYLFEGMAGSFALVPLPYIDVQTALQDHVVGFFAQALLLVFQIAAPVLAALFLVNLGLALMARVAPQLNVFSIGFPLQIIVGLLMLVVSLPLLITVLPQVFAQTPRELDTVLRLLRAPA